MFYRNNAVFVALFILNAIGLHNLSKTLLNSVTVDSRSDLEGNCYRTSSNQDNLSVANPMFSPASTKIFTANITDICRGFTSDHILVAINPTTTSTFTTIISICIRAIVLNSPTLTNYGFRGSLCFAIKNKVPTEYYFTLNPNSEYLL